MHTALIIDDDPLNLRLLSAMLTRFDFEVDTAGRGDHGVDMAYKIKPDLILVDLLMPKSTYDGLEVAQILKDSGKFETTPIVAISAADTHTIRKQIVNDLFVDFVQKPITLEKLELLFGRLNQLDIA